MDKGNTALILNPFVEGMRDAGAQVKVLYSKRLDVKPCTGEFKCWSDTPGHCYIKDEMAQVLQELRDSDYWVFGVPVYAKLPGEMQNMLNRMMPLLNEEVIVKGRSLLPGIRDPLKINKIALVSSCAFWGLENFELLVETMEFMAKLFDTKLARPLLRPNADLLRPRGIDRPTAKAVFEAARNAGSELVSRDEITARSARQVQIPFMSRDRFLRDHA